MAQVKSKTNIRSPRGQSPSAQRATRLSRNQRKRGASKLIKKAKLILADNTEYTGELFGASQHAEGEVVFNTGMVGYPQSLTDSSYRGQILLFTYPLMGNYGVPSAGKDRYDMPKHFESDTIHVRGVIVAHHSSRAFHWEQSKTLHVWLKENNVPGIAGIDTRALTQKLRQRGVMLGQIVPQNHDAFKTFHDPNKDNLVDEVSVKKPKIYQPKNRRRGRKTVVLIDCGAKHNIIRNLLERNLTVIRVPWNYNFFNLPERFHGIVVSNGPGDPMMAKESCHLVREALAQRIPLFGICLGIQILAIAAGGATYKMKYGHRSQNQPVMDLQTGKCYLTSQNHGFAVSDAKIPKDFAVWMRNVNDTTVEGIIHKKLPFFAVQFHPEATPGPFDTAWLFDKFIKNL